jgi:hypothetical protein
MWLAKAELVKKDGSYHKTVEIVVSSEDTETIRWHPVVIRRALKYSGFDKKIIGEVDSWRIKRLIIIKRLGLWS